MIFKGDGANLDFPKLPSHLREANKRISQICQGGISAETTLEIFFKILGHTGLDPHARYRQSFWSDLLRSKEISQTWLVLAPRIGEFASGEWPIKAHQFGLLEKSRRVDEMHAVLLMRMRDVVIAEWSHAGKCRFWVNTNKHAPKFFKRLYTRDELIDYADYIQQHYFSAEGRWQKDAIAWIDKNATVST